MCTKSEVGTMVDACKYAENVENTIRLYNNVTGKQLKTKPAIQRSVKQCEKCGLYRVSFNVSC